MAQFSQAQWDGPVPNRTVGQMVHPVMGLVLHIEEGSEAGTSGWFHNPAAQVSAHFGASKAGVLQQWVDTDDKAWAIGAGNRFWISIENEGHAGDTLTDGQIDAAAKVLAWLAATDNVPFVVTDDPTRRGLGWHGMGGEAWGHPDCPGRPIIAQRPAILAKAQSYAQAAKSWGGGVRSGGSTSFRAAHPMISAGAQGTPVSHARQLLGITAASTFDAAMTAAVETFQSRNALDVDGEIGPDTWSHLHPLLGDGDHGPGVLELQRALGIAATGDFDATTSDAVQHFQDAHALQSDGVVGPLTYHALLEA